MFKSLEYLCYKTFSIILSKSIILVLVMTKKIILFQYLNVIIIQDEITMSPNYISGIMFP